LKMFWRFKNVRQLRGSDPRGASFLILMSLAGVASGILTAALCGERVTNDLGIPFAAIMAICFALTGVTRSLLKLISFFILAAMAFDVSLFAAIEAELAIRKLLLVVRKSVYPSSLFIGGMVGAFVVLATVLFLVKKSSRLRAVGKRALLWSVIGGVSAPIGWALGPSLGMLVWSGLHAVGLTSPNNTFSNALSGETGYGPPDRMFALFVIWQTTMGFVLGMELRGIRESFTSEKLSLK
jgi:hypothetical protein